MFITFRIINIEDFTCCLTSVGDPQDFAMLNVHTGITISSDNLIFVYYNIMIMNQKKHFLQIIFLNPFTPKYFFIILLNQ